MLWDSSMLMWRHCNKSLWHGSARCWIWGCRNDFYRSVNKDRESALSSQRIRPSISVAILINTHFYNNYCEIIALNRRNKGSTLRCNGYGMGIGRCMPHSLLETADRRSWRLISTSNFQFCALALLLVFRVSVDILVKDLSNGLVPRYVNAFILIYRD